MSPSLDGTLPEYVISQEDNSPLTLYIDFHIFVSPERMFVETHSDPNSVCPSVRPSVKVSVNLFQIAPVRTGSLQL